MRFRKHRYGSKRKNHKTVSTLLQEDNVDWEQLKRRVNSHPQEANKNLIHKLCVLNQNPPSEILDWAIEKFGDQQLIRKSGILSQSEPMTPMELCLSQGNSVSFGTFKKIIQGTMKNDLEKLFENFPVWRIEISEIPFPNLICLLEECPAKHIEEQLFDYLFEPILSGSLEFYDIERMEVVLENVRRLWDITETSINNNSNTLPPSSSSDESKEEGEEHRKAKKMNSNSRKKYLTPHTYLLAMFRKLYPYFDRIKPDDIRFVMKSLSEEEKFHNQFKCVDANGNTLLHHICLNAKEKIQILRDYIEEDIDIMNNEYDHLDETREQRLAPWMELLKFFMEMHPESVGLRNNDGRTPFHICLEQGLPAALILLDSCKDAVESVDPVTKLFPFQLAATSPVIEDEYANNQPTMTFSNQMPDNDNGGGFINQLHYQNQNPFGIFIADGPLPGSAIYMRFDHTNNTNHQNQNEQAMNNHNNNNNNNIIQVDNYNIPPQQHSKNITDSEGDLQLTRIYHLLRSAPHILNSMSNNNYDNDPTCILNSNLFKEINYKKWHAARLCRQYYTKQRSLMNEIQYLEEQLIKERLNTTTTTTLIKDNHNTLNEKKKNTNRLKEET